MKHEDFLSLLDDCDREIRAGQIAQAKTRLARLPHSRIPRSLKFKFARLCRRTGLIALGLKIVTPAVHSPAPAQSVSPSDLAEYALLLQRAGGVREALKILDGIPAGTCPEVLLFRSLCYFNIWEYEPTVALLENYLRGELTPSEALIGKVNYASALVSTERWDQAEEQIRKNIETTHRLGNVRLRGNSHEMLAQVHIGRADWARARVEIETALELMKGSNTMDELFVRKWRALIESRHAGDASPLLAIREEAGRRGHYETVRDADLLALTVEFSDARFEHLYFGSPLPAYRERIARKLGRRPERALYTLGAVDAPPVDIGGLGKVDQFLRLLTNDFYRPLPVGEIFSGLFPQEHFNIFSSPGRVRQILRRARRRLEAERIPATIDLVGGGLKLQVHGHAAFAVPLTVTVTKDPLETQIGRLKQLGKLEFTAREARSALGVSATGARRILARAIEKGLIEPYGAGPAAFYCFKESA